MAGVQIVADPARPHQRVGVQIDRRILRVEVLGFFGPKHARDYTRFERRRVAW